MVGWTFFKLGKTRFKVKNLSFCQINCGQMKWICSDMKVLFVKNISSSNPMLLNSINDDCKDFGEHYSNDIFEYLHFVFYITT